MFKFLKILIRTGNFFSLVLNTVIGSGNEDDDSLFEDSREA